MSYTLVDRQTGTTKSYAPAWYGYSDAALFIYNGEPYLRLTTAVVALGALYYQYNSTTNQVEVYDWRVHNSTPAVDDNVYIVGGQWISNWTATGAGATYVAPHFKASEVWDKDTIYDALQ